MSPSGREITPVFKNLVTFFVVIATFFVLLDIWRVDATPLLASAGIIGLVLGIAARDTLGNFFSGISLYLDKTYKLGDVIELESGERGTVIDMSIRSTTILTRDNIAITVPNGQMNAEPVINESAPAMQSREFDESAIVAQLQFYIDHPALRGRSRHALIERIDARFREDEIEIPFPQRELSFADSDHADRFERRATLSNQADEQYSEQ